MRPSTLISNTLCITAAGGCSIAIRPSSPTAPTCGWVNERSTAHTAVIAASVAPVIVSASSKVPGAAELRDRTGFPPLVFSFTNRESTAWITGRAFSAIRNIQTSFPTRPTCSTLCTDPEAVASITLLAIVIAPTVFGTICQIP